MPLRTADATCKFNIGSRVVDIGDPRHVGELRAIMHGAWAKIVWDNGWTSELRIERIRLAEAV